MYTYIHREREREMTQDEIEAARVERTVHAGVSSAKKNAKAARQELDKLNVGYAKQMQHYLTGSSDVGDVSKVIDRHSKFIHTYIHAYIYIFVCIYIYT